MKVRRGERTPGQRGARIVEQDAARLRGNEIVGALQDLAQGRVQAHVPALGVLVTARAHEEARDLFRRQGEDGAGLDRRVGNGDIVKERGNRHGRLAVQDGPGGVVPISLGFEFEVGHVCSPQARLLKL